MALMREHGWMYIWDRPDVHANQSQALISAEVGKEELCIVVSVTGKGYVKNQCRILTQRGAVGWISQEGLRALSEPREKKR